MKFLLLFLILCSSAGVAFAHSCAAFKNLDDKEHSKELQKVDAIFYGRVVEITEKGDQSYTVKLTVKRAWKGIEEKETTIQYDNPCGRPLFELGDNLLVYGYKSSKNDLINLNCCNFGLFDYERMIREHGEGKFFEEASQPEEIEKSFWSILWDKVTSFFS